MKSWRFFRKAFLGIAAVSMLSLALTGCEKEKEGDHPSGGDHPSKSDHSEHPKGSDHK